MQTDATYKWWYPKGWNVILVLLYYSFCVLPCFSMCKVHTTLDTPTNTVLHTSLFLSRCRSPLLANVTGWTNSSVLLSPFLISHNSSFLLDPFCSFCPSNGYLTAQSDSLFVALARLLYVKHGHFLYFNRPLNASIITDHSLKNESFPPFFSWFSIMELLLQCGSW